MYDAAFPPSTFNQDAAHRGGGSREEMSAMLPLLLVTIFDEPNVGFVNHARRRTSTRALAAYPAEPRAGAVARTQWSRVHRRRRVAAVNRVQKIGHIVHGRTGRVEVGPLGFEPRTKGL